MTTLDKRDYVSIILVSIADYNDNDNSDALFQRVDNAAAPFPTHPEPMPLSHPLPASQGRFIYLLFSHPSLNPFRSANPRAGFSSPVGSL